MENFIALCAVGAERVTANELKKLELSVLETAFGRVRFKADIRGCYRALMALRTADRVLWEAAFFPAADFDALFEGVKAVEWERFIPNGMGLKVDKVRSNRSQLRGITTIQAMVHKAAAERLCRQYRRTRLPEGGLMAELRVYVEKDQVSVLLDLSGAPLFKRGYRIEGGTAPLRETTAAALLFLANWRRKFPLYDPFCGSGTIVIEAALYAWDLAPGLGRAFALGGMVPQDKEIERTVREELLAKVDFSRVIRIYGSDGDERALSMAKSNLARASALARGGEHNAKALAPALRVSAMKDAKAPAGEAGFIITNPPYGIRLGDPETAEAMYREMEVLGRNFSGWKLACITDHAGFESLFGRKASACKEITNGAIRSYFYQYEKL
jgi:putative N6-adenine-specific DNA methylase